MISTSAAGSGAPKHSSPHCQNCRKRSFCGRCPRNIGSQYDRRTGCGARWRPCSRYLEHGLHRAPQPVRLSYWDPMFRGQRPQKLRFRQFWQWGLECFGAPEPAADVEIIEFTVGLLAELGLTDYVLKVNTIGGAESREHVKAALTGYFERYREDLDA